MLLKGGQLSNGQLTIISLKQYIFENNFNNTLPRLRVF